MKIESGDKVLIIGIGGILLAAAGLAYLQNAGLKSEKKSHFVDKNLSEAEGKKEIILPADAAKKKYRPFSWVRVGKNWIWTDENGNLVITDGI